MEMCCYDISEVSHLLGQFGVDELAIGEINAKVDNINELMALGMSVTPRGYTNQLGQPVCLIADDYVDKILDIAQLRPLTMAINALTPIWI